MYFYIKTGGIIQCLRRYMQKGISLTVSVSLGSDINKTQILKRKVGYKKRYYVE